MAVANVCWSVEQSSTKSGFQFDTSPQRKEHQYIRQEGLLKLATHDVCVVDQTPLTAEQLKNQPTPPKRRLMMIPKKGHGSRCVLYANYCTGPLLVTVDLIDTNIQRLTHRVRVLAWGHFQQQQQSPNLNTFQEMVAKVGHLSTASEDWNIHNLTYPNLVRLVWGQNSGNIPDLEDEELFEESEVVGFEALQDTTDEECNLAEQYAAAKATVFRAQSLNEISIPWVDCLLQVAECGLLLSSLNTTSDEVLMSPAKLRQQLMVFMSSRTKTERIEAAHLFGSLLFRDFLAEVREAQGVEEDVKGDGHLGLDASASWFFLPQQPPRTIPMEQPLFAPKAFGCNFSKLEDLEEILSDIWEDKNRSLRSLAEDVPNAQELLTMAIIFWQKQIQAMREKRSSRKEKRKAQKKPRLGD